VRARARSGADPCPRGDYEGAITPQIAREFPLTDAAAALRYAEAGGITGKVLLIPEANLTQPTGAQGVVPLA
jgi:NADPH:quinone reductase-like Zn-dependent oxidoreductase